MEYGIASKTDYRGRGAKAGAYTSFIVSELLPFLHRKLAGFSLSGIWMAGFSLGGLSAFDIAWNHPEIFSGAGLFSGSFWWRSLDQDDPQYRDQQHRIMHRLVRESSKRPGMRFFFQCGALDEARDRNRNGIIDSIDDTLDLIHELESLGYSRGREIQYLELADGRHDIPTWSRALPEFFTWAFA